MGDEAEGFNFNDEKYRGDSAYLSNDEKEDLAKSNQVFTITGCVYEADGGFKGAPRFKVSVVLTDGSERILSFGTGVASRDQALNDLVEYLDNEDVDGVDAYLDKGGNAFILRSPGL